MSKFKTYKVVDVEGDDYKELNTCHEEDSNLNLVPKQIRELKHTLAAFILAFLIFVWLFLTILIDTRDQLEQLALNTKCPIYNQQEYYA